MKTLEGWLNTQKKPLTLSPLSIAITLALTGPMGTAQASVSCVGGVGNYSVNSNSDSDDGNLGNGVTSLREALTDINDDSSGCESYLLSIDNSLHGQSLSVASSSGMWANTADITIQAPQATYLTIKTTAADVRAFAAIESGRLTIDNLIIDGENIDHSSDGVSLLTVESGSTLIIKNSVVKNRNGQDSVVGSNGSSNIQIINSTFDGNTSANRGGAIRTFGHLTITDSVFTNNTTTDISAGGGAVQVQIDGESGVLSISGSTFDSNSSSRNGGALYVSQSGSTVNITDSTFSNNSAVDNGGAIYTTSEGGTIDFNQITVSGNSTDTNAESSRGGGLFFSSSANHSISHSTITDNHSINGGGVAGQFASITVDHTIIAGNTAVGAGSDVSGTFTFTHSLVGDNEGSPVAGVSNLQGDSTAAGVLDAQLNPLADNGGATKTHYPIAGSPIIDAGDVAIMGEPAFDQRGSTRVLSGTIDMGAVEFQNMPPTATDISDISVTVADEINDDLSIYFTDPEGDDLTYAQTGLPANLSLSAAGVLTGTVTEENLTDGPTYVVTVTASDGSLSVSKPVMITVSAVSTGGGSLGMGLFGLLFAMAFRRRQ